MLLVSAIGDEDRFVCGLVLHQLTFSFFENANHFVGDAVDKNGFAKSIVAGIESFGDVRGDDRDVGALKIFRFVEEAAVVGVGVEDLFRRGESAVVIDAGNFLAAVAGGAGAAAWALFGESGQDLSGDGADVGTEIADGFRVFEAERLAHALIGGEAAGVNTGIETEDEQGFGPIVAEVGVHV